MNTGELKLQNFFFNSQLQLNNDLFSSNESVSNFDNILKNKTIERSDVGRETDYKGFTNATMDKEVGVRFNQDRADFNQSRDVGELKESIREGIAQKKFQKENEGLHLGEDLSDKVKNLKELQKQIKELEKAIRDDLGIAEEAEGLEQMAMLMGVDVEVLVEQLTQGTLTSEEQTELLDQIVEMLVSEEVDTKTLVRELKAAAVELPKEEMVEFEKMLSEIVAKLPEGEAKEAIELLDKIVPEMTAEEALIENVPVEVQEQVQTVVQTQTNNESKTNSLTPTESTVVQTPEMEVQVVEAKSEQPKDEMLSQQEQKPILSLEDKGEAKSTNTVNLEEQVNVMKNENTLITSAKSEPRAVLARSVMNQIVQGTKMSVNLADQGSEILIKLNPKNLGNVALKMAFDKGTLLAQIQVENQTVKGIVESNLEDLKNALRDEGYTIGDLDVSVNKENTGQNEQGFSQQFKNQLKQETFEEVEERLTKEKNLVNDKEVDYLA